MLFAACKTNYDSVAFDQNKTPAKPDYSKTESWAVLPGNYPEDLKLLVKETASKKADVFFVYPTLLTDKKNSAWNADVNMYCLLIWRTRMMVVKTAMKAITHHGNHYHQWRRMSEEATSLWHAVCLRGRTPSF